ncbi:hypothetical protein K505DRAFT_284789 [Melanomma pulvis-pyrius CBS 109.77]|uniref:Uncharacterized protein n=1 Tax=Melanomma pulvis-pyrius CBS 109.77 TaxID=1314802 RepID=A0A6A6WZ72_9PLEO|nr:hypothetical protein K505DRAFT_284789 [Melanomma pulvis-pyrius CBS 109.77]
MANIYGPMDLFDDVGEFLQDNHQYLQTPKGCDRNVPYRNPQMMAGLDDVPQWTFDFDSPPHEFEKLEGATGLMDSLQTDEILPESETPPGLKTALYAHQKQALSFMKRRERGWNLDSPSADIWSIDRQYSRAEYVNNITGDRHDKSPPMFRGGILADDMGLGKTLSMIGLVASDSREFQPQQSLVGRPTYHRATLLIVPSSLLQQWEDQLIMHLQTSSPSRIRWMKYHGPSRMIDHKMLHTYDIVITSFQTLASQYRKRSDSQSVLFSTTWRRLILDEAHTIRNRKTTTAKAVFDLEAESRWAMTGTPIQNRISDFSSILQFLRVYPYCDRQVFEADIVRAWRLEDSELALGRLKRLFQCIAIRRNRNSIELPERSDSRMYVHFNDEELTAYRHIESPIIEMIDTVLLEELQKPGTYMHALLKINSLRRFCNIGIDSQAPGPEISYTSVSSIGIPNGSDVQAVVDDLLSSGQAACALCNSDVRFVLEEDGSPTKETPSAYLSECMRLICLICYRQNDTSDVAPLRVCMNHTPCLLSSAIVAPTPQLSRNNLGSPMRLKISSKVMSLKKELQKLTSEKSVVFSAWTSTLDMVQTMLVDSSIPFARIDGSVSTKNRITNLHRFQNDPAVQVLLITISIGAEGLNLTVASRAYLMEPQWNPSVEEQALARIHRLGQTRKVKTIRFVVKDSIEDHVINIQDRKKNLAELLFPQEKAGLVKGGLERLQNLRDLLS